MWPSWVRPRFRQTLPIQKSKGDAFHLSGEDGDHEGDTGRNQPGLNHADDRKIEQPLTEGEEALAEGACENEKEDHSVPPKLRPTICSRQTFPGCRSRVKHDDDPPSERDGVLNLECMKDIGKDHRQERQLNVAKKQRSQPKIVWRLRVLPSRNFSFLGFTGASVI